MKKYRILFCLLLTIAIGCALAVYIRSALPNKHFTDFTAALFRNEVASNALTLHYTLAHPKEYGIRDYEVTLGSISPEGAVETCSSIENLSAALHSLDNPRLTKENRLTYDILSYYLNGQRDQLDYYLYPEIFSPNQGLQSQLPIVLAEYSFRNKKDIEDYLTLLQSLDTYFAEAISFEQYRSRQGLTMADFAMDTVINQCDSFCSRKDSHYLKSTFESRLDELSFINEEEKKAYCKRNDELLSNHVFPAYMHLKSAMSALKEQAPHTMALCSYPSGKEYYENLVRSETGSDKSIYELKSLMQEQFSLDYLAYRDMMTEEDSLPAGTPADSFGNKPALMLEDLQSKMTNDFPALPDTHYTIKYVEKTLQDFMSPAFYMIPAIDDYDRNVIYINPASNYSSLSLYTTLAHEGYPGHLYQTNYFKRLNPDPIRGLLNFDGYTEGWALYVEMYSYDLFQAGRAKRELTRLNHSIQLCLYSLMDIAIHYDGLSEADIIANLKRFGISDRETALEIYHYISEEPANYLKYYVGYLEILGLQEMEKEEEMNAFNQKDFHTQLLSIGPAPFPVIRKYITTAAD